MQVLLSYLFLILVPLTSWSAISVKVNSIHDGDTLNATGISDAKKYKIRLLGVDTPEVDFFNHSQGEIAQKSRAALQALIPEGSVVQISDDSQTDKHGRVLGRILADGRDINKEMLRQGWGYLYFIFPFDKRLVSDYIKAAQEAYENSRGVFAKDFAFTEEPYQFRMKVQNLEGKNPVADFETKKIVAPESLQNIPVWKRVFFPNFEFALQNGYKKF
ncbi:MAG: thermonuclease family protein [Bdellovibrio sp.]|nr:thermonuclease family protein [Bdellovibrio sp.]